MKETDVKTKILLVDDHAIVRAGFRFLLEAIDNYDIKEASTAEEACSIYKKYKPDAVIMDLIMPGMGGLEGVRHICAKDNKAKVLILSTRDDLIYFNKAKKAGAIGYITKNSAIEELTKAVCNVINGEEYISTDIHSRHNSKTDDDKIKCLSKREFEIFCLLAEGKRVADISNNIHLSPKTVSNHRTHIMHKLNASSIAELTRLAIRYGLIEA